MIPYPKTHFHVLELDLGRVLLEDRHVSTRVFPRGSFHRDGQADLKLETVRKPVDLADLADLAPSVSFEFLELGLVSSLPFRVSIGK